MTFANFFAKLNINKLQQNFSSYFFTFDRSQKVIFFISENKFLLFLNLLYNFNKKDLRKTIVLKYKIIFINFN